MDDAERAELRAVGRVLPGCLTRIAAPGAERGQEPEGEWAAADGAGWVYFGTELEALEYAAKLVRHPCDENREKYSGKYSGPSRKALKLLAIGDRP